MKKIISLSIGLMLLGSAVVVITNASRNTYHEYLLKKTNEQRQERRFSSTGRLLTANSTSEKASNSYMRKNLVFPQRNTRYYYAQGRKRMDERDGYIANTNPVVYPNKRYAVTKADSFSMSLDNLETYENDMFSLQLPTAWEVTHENGYFEIENAGGINFTIKQLPDQCSQDTGFTVCAATIAKGLNYNSETGKTKNTSSIQRLRFDAEKTRDSQNQNRVYSESFEAQNTTGELFLIRYIVEGFNDEVFVLEATSDLNSESRTVNIMKKIYDSFRIYPLGQRTVN